MMVLFQMTFKRPSHDRQLTFAEIAKETKLPVNEIELLVMKALSQGLVKGAIDQVSFCCFLFISFILTVLFVISGCQYCKYDMGTATCFRQEPNSHHGDQVERMVRSRGYYGKVTGGKSKRNSYSINIQFFFKSAIEV